MIAKVYSAIPNGYEGQIIEVEGSTSRNLPTFNIVGMANKTVSEARERVRSAITNSGFIFPTKKVTINLAPAELIKNGSQLDLPIAIAILLLSKQLLPTDLTGKLFVGELSLDGLTRPIRGIINIIESARNNGFKEVFLPIENLSQARLVPGIHLIGVQSLHELLFHLKGIKLIIPSVPQKLETTPLKPPFLDDIKGQVLAKRALMIALAGHHNLLLSGPPGSGKTLLARVAANLLPDPTPEEQISITKIHSLENSTSNLLHRRPFRSPHHTASYTSIIGGGAHIHPGEITLAHHGILFLDELPEYPRSVIEALRQPLEDKNISITRAEQRVIYPADFMLIATMNPCPCGYLNDPHQECHCTPIQIANYRKKISGPILDRIDLILNVEKVSTTELSSSQNVVKNTKTDNNRTKSNTTNPPPNEHTVVKNKITEAIQKQSNRYKRPGFYNNSLTPQEIQQYIHMTSPAKSLLNTAAEKLKISARSYYKIIKVAQTIADLTEGSEITTEHISEAIALRQPPLF